MKRGSKILLLTLLWATTWLYANSPPYFTATVSDTITLEDEFWNVWLEAADNDDDILTFALSDGAPAGLTINSASGLVAWIPDNSQVGTHTITVSVSDASVSNYMTFNLHVQNTNDAPVWTQTPAEQIEMQEDSLLTLQLTASDDDAVWGDQITYVLKLGPGNASLNPSTGTLTWRPNNAHVGYQTFSVWAQDDSATTIQTTWSVHVFNSPVTFSSAPVTEIIEDHAYNCDLQSSDEGQGGTVYTFVPGYIPTWLMLNATSGVLSGTPDNLDIGSDSVKINVADGNGSTAVLAFEIDVINNKPTITTALMADATEDVAYSFDISADDEGIGNTFYQFLTALETPPSWLNLESETGLVTGTPDNSHVGANTFTIEFNDGNGGKDTSQLSIPVVNLAPLIDRSNISSTITEDTEYSMDFNCSDDGQGAITYFGINLPVWLTMNASTGVLSGTPTNEYNGTHAIEIYVSDGNIGGHDTVTYDLTVTNRIPQLESSAITAVTEDHLYSYNINYDDESHGAVYSITVNPGWLSIDDATGVLTGTPTNSSVGTSAVSVQIDDGFGGVVYHEFSITVENRAPVFSTLDDSTIYEDATFNLNVNCDDEGDPSVTYTLNAPPEGMTINSTTGVIAWTPDNSLVGSYIISVTAADNHSGQTTETFDLTVANVAPELAIAPPTSVLENTLYSYDVDCNDEGVGNTNYALTTNPGWLSIDAENGLITGTPGDEYVGANIATVRVDDGNGGIDSYSWTITVINQAPQITTNLISAATEDAAYSNPIAVEPDNPGEYIYSFVGAKPDWLTINPATGTLTGTPTNSDVGRETITVRVTDGHGAYDDQELILDIVNVAPAFTTTDVINIAEDSEISVNLNTDDEGDEGGGESGYTLMSYPDWLSINATTGVLSGTPRDTDVGTTAIEVRYKDGNAGSATLNTNIIVSNVNPVITATDPPTTGVEDQAYAGYQFTSDDDPWGAVTYSSLYTLPTSLTLTSAGLLSGNLKNADVGVHNLGIIATDNNGGKDTLEFVLTISNVAPVISGLAVTISSYTQNGDTLIVTEDKSYQFDLTASDENDGALAKYTFTHKPEWLTIGSLITGILTGTPTNLYVGLDSLQVTFSDGNGGTATKKYYVRVANVAVQFTTAGGVEDVYEDQSYTLDLNSTDDGQGTITYSILSGDPGWLELNSATGLISSKDGRPSNDDVSAGDAVDFKVTDGNGGSDTLTIIFIVHNVNDAPTWTSVPGGIITHAEDAVYNVTPTVNDVDVGDNITFTFLNNPTGMTINSSTGQISWTPDNSQVGDLTVTIKASDEAAASITATWTMHITNVASPITALTTTDFLPAAAVSAVADTFYLYEDTTYTINFSTPDEGIGSSETVKYSFDEFPNPDWVTLSNTTTGIVTLTPSNNDVGLDYFKIFFTDQPGSADTAAIYLRVQNVAPVITTTGPFTATEDLAFEDSIRCNDHGDGTITYSFVSGKPTWMALDASTGIISGTPTNANVTANSSFTIQADDGNGGTVNKSFNYSVTNANDAPVWSSAPSGTVTTAEDAVYTTTLSVTDDDAGDVITYSLTSKPSGMTVNSSSGVITWTPDNSQVGDHSVTARASDVAGAFASRTWTVSVTNAASPINVISTTDFSPSDAVSATVDTFYIYEDTVYTLSFSAPDEGVGDDSHYFISGLGNPDWVTLSDADNGIIRLTPENLDVGLKPIQVAFTDQPTSFDTLQIYLRVVNTPPTLTAAGPFNATEEVSFEYDLSCSDEGSGTVVYSFFDGHPAWLNIASATGVLSGTPGNSDVGSSDFAILVSDGNGGTASRVYSITVANVNDAPTITAIADTTINEDVTFTYSVSASDVDADDELTYSLSTYPSGMTINSTTGVISWTPNNSHVGEQEVLVKVEDSAGATVTTAFTITVTNVLPTFETITVSSLTEDAAFSYNVNCSDENQGTVTYSLTSPPDWLSINQLTGLLSGTPNNLYVGSHSQTISVNDGTGNVSVVWNYTVVNVPPVFTTEADTAADEDQLYSYDANCSDDDQGTITYSATTLPGWLSLASATGVLSGTPQNSQVGDTIVVLKVADGNGGTATQSFTLHVINTNDAPSITSTAVTTATEDSQYQYDLNATDPDGDILTFSLVNYPDGMTINSSTGLITWTPDNSNVGQVVSIQARVSDGNGGTADQNWTITTTNRVPVITTTDAILYATEDSEFSYNVDADDEGLGITTYRLLVHPDWLTLSNASSGALSGTPDNSQVTTGDSLVMEFSDGNGGKDTLFALVAVNNTAPVFPAQSDTSATEGSFFALDLNCSDEGQGKMTYVSTGSLPDWLTLNDSTGILSGTPANKNVTATTITIRVHDGHGGYANLSFALTVDNIAPTIAGTPTASIAEDNAYSYTFHLIDETGTNIYMLDINPGWLSINSTSGVLSGTPRNNHVGDNTVRVIASDGNGGKDSSEFIISVSNVAPVITTSPVTSAQEDLAYSLDINCTDDGYGIMTYSALQKPTWLSLNQSTGVLSGIPKNNNVTTAVTIEIKVDDGHSGYDTLAFNLAVNNTAPIFASVFSDTIITEDDAFTYDLYANDENQGSATRYQFVVNPLTWLAIDSLSGALSGTPLNNHVAGSQSVQVRFSDGNGGAAAVTFFIEVDNNPPVFTSTPDDSVAAENELFTYDATTSDEGQGSVAYSIIGSIPDWLALDDSSGVLSGTPDNSQIDTSLIVIRFNDGNGGQVDQSFHLIVENANDAPYLTTVLDSTSTHEDLTWTMTFTAGDSDLVYGDSFAFLLAEAPSGMTIDANTGQVSWTPDNAFVGNNRFYIIAEDLAGARDSLQFTLTITNVNDAPTLTAVSDTTIYEDDAFNISIGYTEIDVGDTVCFTLLTGPEAMAIDSLSGAIAWIPTNDDRDSTFEIIIRINDIAGATDRDTFFVHVNNVNDAPALAALAEITFDEDSTWQQLISGWYDRVTDIDNSDSLLNWEVIDLQNVVAHFGLSGSDIVFSAPADWFGNDTGKVIVSDGALSDTSELVIHVLPVNDAPVISAAFPDTVEFAEDDTTRLHLNQLVSDVDNDSTELVWSVEALASGSGSSKASNEILKLFTLKSVTAAKSTRRPVTAQYLLNSTGDSLYIEINHTTNIAKLYARPNFFTDGLAFRFIVADGVAPVAFLADSVITGVKVAPVNDAPVLSALPDYTAPEDTILEIAFTDFYDYVADVDNPDGTLTWNIDSGQHLSNIIQTETGLTITPPANWFGLDTLSIIAYDGQKADTTALPIQYLSVNDQPAFDALADTSFSEDDTIHIALNPFISDVENSDTELTLTARRISALTTATDSIVVSINPETHVAAICGTPNYFCTATTYAFYVYDDSSAYDSVLINITIESVNDPPVLASIPAITFREDSTYRVELANWNDYVSDVETADDSLRWSFSIDTGVIIDFDSTGRILTLSDTPNWVGTASLTAIVNDQNKATDTAIVSVIVLPKNDPPVIDSSLLAIHFYQNDTLSFNLADYVTDPDNPDDSLRWSFIFGENVNSTFNDTTRVLQFWVGYEWFGQDTIAVSVSDPGNLSDAKTIIVTVSDTTRPYLTYEFFQNQQDSKLVGITFYPSESLADLPFLMFNSDTSNISEISTDTATYYNTTYHIDSTCTVTMLTAADDLAGNRGRQTYSFSVARISVTGGGTLNDPDGVMTFIVPAKAVERDLCMLFLPDQDADTTLRLSKRNNILSATNQPVAPEVDFVATVSTLSADMRILFDVEKLSMDQEAAAYLGLYHYENGKWKYLTTYTSLETGTFWAYSRKTGKYQIRTSPDHPAVILPDKYSIAQNYPNPFNSSTVINYIVGAESFDSYEEAVIQLQPVRTTIKIYNLLGQEVRTLVNEPKLPGKYQIFWDARNSAGIPVASGPYFLQAILGDKIFNKKMMVIK